LLCRDWFEAIDLEKAISGESARVACIRGRQRYVDGRPSHNALIRMARFVSGPVRKMNTERFKRLTAQKGEYFIRAQ
jgi:hypothetical protein